MSSLSREVSSNQFAVKKQQTTSNMSAIKGHNSNKKQPVFTPSKSILDAVPGFLNKVVVTTKSSHVVKGNTPFDPPISWSHSKDRVQEQAT